MTGDSKNNTWGLKSSTDPEETTDVIKGRILTTSLN